MGNWHTYLMGENSLFAERHFLYKGEKLSPPNSPETVKDKPGEGEKPPTLEDVKEKLGDAKEKLTKMQEKYGDEKIKKLNSKIKKIEERIKDVEKQKKQEKQKIIKQISEEIDNIIYKITGKRPEKVKKPEDASKDQPKPKANPEAGGVDEGKKKPNESKETPLSRLDRSKQRLGRYLDDVVKNPDKFKQLRSHINMTINTILRKMGIDIRNVEKTQYLNVPGGYRMSIQKWTRNQDKMPNAIIYKGNDLLCYKDYGVLRQASKNNMDSASRTAQVVKCFDQFPKSFTVTGGKFRVINKDNFAKLAMDIARYSRKDKPWTARLSTCRISYKPSNNQISLVVRGLPGKVVYNPSDPHKMKMIPEGKTSAEAVDISTYVEKPKEKKSRENEKIKRKKQREQKKQQEREKKREAARKQAERKALQEKVSKSIDSEFKRLITSSDKPNSFTVKAEKKDRKGLRLIDKTPIHKLLSLEQNKGEVVKITINGEKGKREAMYYPGQKTAYEVNSSGKQTNNRVKFYNGDTITVDFKEPKEGDYANLNSDKEARMHPKRIEGRKLFSNLMNSINKFKKLEGKLSDLNLKPLEKFKSKTYNPKKILTGKNWQKKFFKQRKMKKNLHIVKAELAVIDEGVNKKNENDSSS